MLVKKIENLEKKIEQQKKRLNQRESFLREQKRKAIISKKIALGSLLFQTELDQLDEETLLGGMLFLKEKSQDENLVHEWRQAAKNFKEISKKSQGRKKKNDDDHLKIID